MILKLHQDLKIMKNIQIKKSNKDKEHLIRSWSLPISNLNKKINKKQRFKFKKNRNSIVENQS